jgi:hypothetical protein
MRTNAPRITVPILNKKVAVEGFSRPPIGVLPKDLCRVSIILVKPGFVDGGRELAWLEERFQSGGAVGGFVKFSRDGPSSLTSATYMSMGYPQSSTAATLSLAVGTFTKTTGPAAATFVA